MSVSIRVDVQQRIFQYVGYSVLIREKYLAWGDLPGRPSFWDVFYIDQEKENILELLKRVDFYALKREGVDLLIKQGLKFFTVKNTFVGHRMDWAIEKAKKQIQEDTAA